MGCPERTLGKEGGMHRVLVAVMVAGVLASSVVAHGQMSYTTLGDQDYGNPHKSFNGVGIPTWIDSLLRGGGPLVLGASERSLTFEVAAGPCITAGLPASSRPAAFPEELGDAVVDSTCELPPDLPANNHGKFENQLLGETIALSLNTRLDPDLIDLEVCAWMFTVQGFAGPDSLYGTDDDTMCVACDTMTVRIPETVLTAIADSMAMTPTVRTVLDFANMALGGEGIYGASYHDVWQAVKNLNRAFKRCRFLVGCVNDGVDVIETFPARESLEGNVVAGHEGALGESGTWLAATSPVRDVATIRYSVPEESRVRIVAYSVAGRQVAVLRDGTAAAGEGAIDVRVDREKGFASGVYLIRMTATSLLSGEAYAETGKLIVVR
jgi:hypothetical protein